MLQRHCVLTLAGLVTLSACSNDSGSSEGGVGGASNVGGTKSSSVGGSANGGAVSVGGTVSRGGASASDSSVVAGGAVDSGGDTSASNGGTGAVTASGGTTNGTGSSAKGGVASGGTTTRGGTSSGDVKGGATSNGGVGAKGGDVNAAGASVKGGASAGGTSAKGGATTGGVTNGGASAKGGTENSSGTTSSAGKCSGPIGNFSGELATGINFTDTDGNRVNAHGGGIIKVGDTYYMHGEYFLSTTTDNNFNGFSMYSSKDLATWKNEGIILPQQPSGELGPVRKGERPHIIKCPATGEFVLYAHAADETYQADKEVVYATSATVNGKYSYKGPLTNSAGTPAAHSDMSAFADGNNAYVLTESGHVYTLSSDCHSWLTDKAYSALNGDSGGVESPTVFKAGSTYYWIGSYKTGWRANNNFYSTAPAMTGPWTYQGFIAPVTDTADKLSDERTWLSQSTWVQPIEGCAGTTYVYWGDHWDGNLDATAQGKHNYLATYVFQPLVFDGTKISMPTYHATWTLDVGNGT
ncbi:MAG TPA: family 43 glycosylhydrolase, partial [Polyangiaceae bacterium]